MATADRLRVELQKRRTAVRSPEVVMRPTTLGAARLTRYSFSRMMLRRAAADDWRAVRKVFDIDAKGRGEAVYELDTGSRKFSFVAFTTTISEDQHTDRVVAERWEVSAALLEGVPTPGDLDTLRSQVPLQEAGRFDPRVLVLTRGNRSVRFFQYLVDCLATGSQPEPGQVADAGYILRSTAFYANGKYGMRSFDGYPPGHELAVPYRAQFVAAWLFRELGYDLVEHCARALGGADAIGFNEEWRRYFGLGNATGLGLVPYAFKHPQVMNAWASIRELALADVRALEATPFRLARLDDWVARAHRHFATGTADDCAPFLNAPALVVVLKEIRAFIDTVRSDPRAFDTIYRWAETKDPETTELVVSLLIELHDGDDSVIDELLMFTEHSDTDPATTVGQLRTLITERFEWLNELDLDDDDADFYWWVISDNAEEPRRVPRPRLDPDGRDVAIDFAIRIWRLRAALAELPDQLSVAEFLTQQPFHRMAVNRLAASDSLYGEPHDNPCGARFLPLQVQRFQLAMYGMDNFKPKSTDWLRVTLFQGAPRLTDLDPAMGDSWAFPCRPSNPGRPR
ncbi:MAG: hypothetical protein OXN44_11305 [Acidimicrobiaceae bacterium]|nr:hypothetical protein [Acidimicrobiaceae bacterium]